MYYGEPDISRYELGLWLAIITTTVVLILFLLVWSAEPDFSKGMSLSLPFNTEKELDYETVSCYTRDWEKYPSWSLKTGGWFKFLEERIYEDGTRTRRYYPE